MRFTKLLNPLIFTNSENISLSNQLSRIKNKLYENANYYFIKLIKLALVESLIRGKATKYISPRLKEDAINLYTIV